MPPARLARSASLTHPGLARPNNEDAVLALDEPGLWVVADGMGGHAHGAWAAAQVIDAFRSLDGPLDRAAMAEAVQAANLAIFQAARAAGAVMGSTVVALAHGPEGLVCLWAGDSRLYQLSEGVLIRRTRDHSQVQDLVDQGLVRPEAAARHPLSNLLSRAVGVAANLVADEAVFAARAGDRLLLCSDGLSGVVADSEIADRLGRGTADAARDELLSLVLARGAPDNVSLIIIDLEADPATAT